MDGNQYTLKISIIVPVYNAERYLKDCIDSIIKQSYSNFELLLVDDGSFDNSSAVCDGYALKDDRIKVIHKQNGGVSSARNAGIEAAVGEYIVFIDSDDYVGKNYLQELVNAPEEAGDTKTLIISDYQPFSEAGAETRFFPNPFSVCFDICSATADNFRELVFQFRIFPPYCKLYSNKIIKDNHIRFDEELKSAEDFDFNLRYLKYIKRIVYLPLANYHYRVGYKKYKPSNHGVLGTSEIKSVHIMANGIVDFAKRLGVFDEVYDEICMWAAKKHYYNRLPMLFAESSEVSITERRKLYNELAGDDTYHALYKRGIELMSRSTTQVIGNRFDCFDSWLLFYKALILRNE